jgi:L-lactate dehydrogenase (cytochrome)
MLPKIKSVLNDSVELWLDGGIRSGQDILKSIALGADSTLIGRAFLYGLGANGKEGVKKSLEIIRKELDLTMALCGRNNINNVKSDILQKDYFDR